MQWHSFELRYSGYSHMLSEGAQTMRAIQEQMRSPALFLQMNNHDFGVFVSDKTEPFTNTFWFTEPAYHALRAFADANGAAPSGPPPPLGSSDGLRGTTLIIGDTRAWHHIPGYPPKS